jgi:hypothetical protein
MEPMVLEIKEPDMSCYPYRRKGLYLVIAIPYIAVLASVFLYLLLKKEHGEKAGRRFVPALVYLSFYLGMCYFQAYCCACQECPYIGEFCPAIAGIYPANILARMKFGDKEQIKEMAKSERRLQANATLAAICMGGTIVFPLYWLAKRSAFTAAGYLFINAVYYLFHLLGVCPVCAIRDTCPGGQLQARVLG